MEHLVAKVQIFQSGFGGVQNRAERQTNIGFNISNLKTDSILVLCLGYSLLLFKVAKKSLNTLYHCIAYYYLHRNN